MIEYVFSYTSYMTLWFGYYMGGWWNSLSILYFYILIPIIDEITKRKITKIVTDKTINTITDKTINTITNKDKTLVKKYEKYIIDKFGEEQCYKIILDIWSILYLVNIIIVTLFISSVSTIELLLIIIANGLVSSVSLIISHELLHKKSIKNKILSLSILLYNSYPHFYWQHKNHHINVATPLDPATAPLFENIYYFVPKSILLGYLQCIKQRPWIILLTILSLCFNIFSLYYDINVGLFFSLQSITAICLLETVNYFEHYGLSRNYSSISSQNISFSYEPVKPRHSWDSYYLWSNLLMFNLGKHADHHVYPYKYYYLLSTSSSSPILPFPYPLMILLSLFPSFFRSYIHPLISIPSNIPISKLKSH